MLLNKGLPVEVIDGEVYRKKLYPELGFSREERCENIRKLGWLASRFVSQGVISLYLHRASHQPIKLPFIHNTTGYNL